MCAQWQKKTSVNRMSVYVDTTPCASTLLGVSAASVCLGTRSWQIGLSSPTTDSVWVRSCSLCCKMCFVLWGQIITNLRTLCLQARVPGGLPMCFCIYCHLVWANNIPTCPFVLSLPMVWQTSTSAWKLGTSVVPMPTVATPSENTPAPVSQDMQSRMLRVTRALVRHLFVWMLFTFFCKL